MNENLILADLSGRDYLDLLGSAAPAPGGGAASALLGAQGCALGQMVCELTKGRAKYADSQKLVTEAAETLSSLRSELLSLADEDAQGYQGVMDVFALPKTSEEEILRRKTALEAALQACTKTPFRVMQRCEEGLQVIRTLLGRTNRNATSDDKGTAIDDNQAPDKLGEQYFRESGDLEQDADTIIQIGRQELADGQPVKRFYKIIKHRGCPQDSTIYAIKDNAAYSIYGCVIVPDPMGEQLQKFIAAEYKNNKRTAAKTGNGNKTGNASTWNDYPENENFTINDIL